MEALLNQMNWAQLFASDPGMGVAIVEADGEIVFASESAIALFGADPNQDVEGQNIEAFFHPEFARERLAWIQRVCEEKKPLTVRHIYQGKHIVSTLMPAGAEPDQDRVLIVSRLASPNDPPANIEEVQSDLLDLGRLSTLSDRELEVLVLLGHGRSVPETARLLHRSPRTIERHKEQIGHKLGASTIAEIVKIVSRLGLSVDHLQLKRLHALKPDVATPPAASARTEASTATEPSTPTSGISATTTDQYPSSHPNLPR